MAILNLTVFNHVKTSTFEGQCLYAPRILVWGLALGVIFNVPTKPAPHHRHGKTKSKRNSDPPHAWEGVVGGPKFVSIVSSRGL